MRAPKSPAGQFFTFGAIELVSFAILCASTRAMAAGLVGWTAVTSFFFATQSVVTWKLMIDDSNARTWPACAGMIVGGVIGDVLSVILTKRLFGV
jgi:hypothetical protein